MAHRVTRRLLSWCLIGAVWGVEAPARSDSRGKIPVAILRVKDSTQTLDPALLRTEIEAAATQEGTLMPISSSRVMAKARQLGIPERALLQKVNLSVVGQELGVRYLILSSVRNQQSTRVLSLYILDSSSGEWIKRHFRFPGSGIDQSIVNRSIRRVAEMLATREQAYRASSIIPTEVDTNDRPTRRSRQVTDTQSRRRRDRVEDRSSVKSWNFDLSAGGDFLASTYTLVGLQKGNYQVPPTGGATVASVVGYRFSDSPIQSKLELAFSYNPFVQFAFDDLIVPNPARGAYSYFRGYLGLHWRAASSIDLELVTGALIHQLAVEPQVDQNNQPISAVPSMKYTLFPVGLGGTFYFRPDEIGIRTRVHLYPANGMSRATETPYVTAQEIQFNGILNPLHLTGGFFWSLRPTVQLTLDVSLLRFNGALVGLADAERANFLGLIQPTDLQNSFTRIHLGAHLLF